MLMENQIKSNVQLEEMADSYLEKDDFYEAMATPLKPAKQWKNEHRKQILETLNLNDFSINMDKAVEIIMDRLPKMVPKADWERIVDEFSHIEQNFQENSVKEQEDGAIVTNQQLMGISDETLNSIYLLGRTLVEEKSFDNALNVFHALCFFNPWVGEYWLGLGICLFHLNEYDQALEILNMAQILQPDKAAAFIYSAFCHLKLNQSDLVNEDIKQIEEVFSQSAEEKSQWEKISEQLKSKIKAC